MEIILLLSGILIFVTFLFLLIEFPYYIVSIFVFLHLYAFNWELPGPLDLRGLVSVVLFVRLIIFDRKNIDAIKGALSNRFLVFIIVFSIYSAIIDFSSNASLVMIVRTIVLNLITLLIGFLTVINGYAKKSIVLAILITGVMSTVDLVYSYSYKNVLVIRRVIDLILGEHPAGMNHNFFGGLCGIALLTLFIIIITKSINKKTAYVLIAIFCAGIFLSTSRMTILTVSVTLIFILLIQREFEFNFKKAIVTGVISIFFVISAVISFTFIAPALNVNSKLVDEIYWRLVEEPLSFFNEEYEKFDEQGFKIEGSARWRINQTIRDAGVFFSQDISVILFGLGTGGYSQIGEIQFRGREAYQYASHNFYTNIVAENGIIGLLAFLSFFIPLLAKGIGLIKNEKLRFTLIYLLLFMFISTFGSNANLTDKFGYILYGCVIADFIMVQESSDQQNAIPI